jgi:hypothetical protein
MTAIEDELEHRLELWTEVAERSREGTLEAGRLTDLRIRRGGRGIYVDKERTNAVTPEGVTVSVLHTGRTYADDLHSDGILYHYPRTRRPGTDTAEVEATKAAGRLELPVFVVVQPRSGSRRIVHLGWVMDWDDSDEMFLIRFGERQPASLPRVGDEDGLPFTLTKARPPKKPMATTPRPGQAQYRFLVLRRYGASCAVCGLAVPELLDAAHFRGVRDNGSDDPRNGLPLCKTHHRAMDLGLFRIEPRSLELRFAPDGPDADALQVTHGSLRHLPYLPHPDALDWCWSRWEHAGAAT